MTTKERDVSLDDGIRRIENDIQEKKEEAQEVQRFETDEDGNLTDDLTEEAQKLQSEYTDLKSKVNALREKREDWGNVSWTITEMTYGEIMRARDEVQRAVQESGVEAGGGSIQVWTLRLGVTDSPDSPSVPDDPADYPLYIGEWLYEEIDRLNTTEEVDLGNLWEAEESSRTGSPEN